MRAHCIHIQGRHVRVGVYSNSGTKIISNLRVDTKGLQWNPSIAATVGEWHFGCYTEVAVVEGFRVLGVLVHVKFKIVVCTEVCAHCKLTILFI